MSIKGEIKKQAEEIERFVDNLTGWEYPFRQEFISRVEQALLERHTKSRSEGFEDAKEQAAKAAEKYTESDLRSVFAAVNHIAGDIRALKEKP